MAKFFRFAPLVALVFYVAIKVALILNEPPTPATPDFTPTADQQQQLIAVQNALADYPQARESIGDLYGAFSTVIAADDRIVKTTSDVRDAHLNAGILAVQAGEIPRVPNLAVAVNQFLKSQIGDDNVPLSDEKRDQVVDAFNALEWAANQ